MKSAQHWYSGRVGSENGTKEWVRFRVSVWRLWTPLERLLRDDQGAKVLPTHRGMGLGESHLQFLWHGWKMLWRSFILHYWQSL